MEKQQLERLWNAAQTHSVITLGEFLDPEWQGEENPPMPENPAELIDQVAEYLESIL